MKKNAFLLLSALLLTGLYSCKKLTEDTICLPPGNLKASVVTQSRVDLSWTASEDGQQYIIFLKKSSESAYKEYSRTKTTAYSLTGLTAGLEYDVRIQTNCSGANSENSDPVRFRLQTEKEFFLTKKWKPDFWKVGGIPVVIQGGDYLDFRADLTYEQRLTGSATTGSWQFTNSDQTTLKIELGGGQVMEWNINSLSSGNADFSGINGTAGDTLNLSPF